MSPICSGPGRIIIQQPSGAAMHPDSFWSPGFYVAPRGAPNEPCRHHGHRLRVAPTSPKCDWAWPWLRTRMARGLRPAASALWPAGLCAAACLRPHWSGSLLSRSVGSAGRGPVLELFTDLGLAVDLPRTMSDHPKTDAPGVARKVRVFILLGQGGAPTSSGMFNLVKPLQKYGCEVTVHTWDDAGTVVANDTTDYERGQEAPRLTSEQNRFFVRMSGSRLVRMECSEC